MQFFDKCSVSVSIESNVVKCMHKKLHVATLLKKITSNVFLSV